MATIDVLQAFLTDEKAWEMYITGKAGTGKTTTLKEVVEYCLANQIDYMVCAFTHKACTVLEEKLPDNANITTLHSYLRKRPTINDSAVHKAHVDVRSRMGESERPDIVIVDEFSMVGEDDYVDIMGMQDPHDEGAKPIKALYVGDPYQLPPVGDMQTIKPKGKYWVKLEKVYRTECDDLLSAMVKLTDMIDGADMEPLGSSQNLIRGQCLIQSYKASTSTDKVCLAWTNKAVQQLNEAIAGKTQPDPSDDLWCPTLRHEFTLEAFLPKTGALPIVRTPRSSLGPNSKYKTLEFLQELPEVSFARVYDSTAEEVVNIAYIFGHYTYKQIINDLTEAAVAVNNQIKAIAGGDIKPAQWASQNQGHGLTRKRAKAWRKLLAIKEAVLCIDFPYAMTIHKSQGSTYEEVYLDSEDLSMCGNTDAKMYLKLFYVALSRASHKVITN